MGNSDSREAAFAPEESAMGDSTTKHHSRPIRSRERRSSTSPNLKAPLHASSSFYRKELQQQSDLDDRSLVDLVSSKDHENEDNPNTTLLIAKLQANIRRLSEKCSALESQNILVAVQQLDWLVRAMPWMMSGLALYGYWKLLSWGVPRIPFGDDDLLNMWKVHSVFPGWLKEFSNYFPSVWIIDRSSAVPILKTSLWTIPYFYNKYTHGSFHRRMQVFAVAFIVIGRIKLCRWREAVFLQPDPEDSNEVPPFGEACTNDGIWKANYEISARFLYLSVKRLRGLWTKSAQYMSSRADFMPLAYIRELSKLQDQAPVTPWKEIDHLLPAKLRNDLIKIDTEPIASASIGQVHMAHLMVNGKEQKVVIKVQHPYARTLMLDDFWSLLVICRIVGWLEPEYAFMEILMREWAYEARKELDFHNELYHLQQAQLALKPMFPNQESVVYTSTTNMCPFRAEVPNPLPEYSTKRVLVMEYCEGTRVDNFSQLEKWNLNRVDVMDGLSQIFAHFMYCSPIFNGDPHLGNFLIRQGLGSSRENEGFTLVLLDWGLAKQLSDNKRLAFCQMVYAAATLDYGLLLDSFKTIGLKMKREDAGQNMEDMRFFLRDMAPRTEAREKIQSKIKQSQELAKKNKEKVPMESKAYPGEMFFFIRVTELLHGLGSKLKIDMKYLDTIRPYAEKGLRTLMNKDIGTQVVTSNAISRVMPSRSPNLERILQDLMRNLEEEGQFVGGQICILNKEGDVEVDVVAGTLGGLKDRIPMQRDALILGYSCTKAVTATLAHIMVEQGYLSLDEPVSERVWKDFCPTNSVPPGLSRLLGMTHAQAEQRWMWKRQITLRHILNHSAGMWTAFPPRLTIKGMASCELCCSAFEYSQSRPEDTILPSRKPGEKSEYHFMSFGWLVAGVLRGAFSTKHKRSNVTFEEVYMTVLYPKLGVSVTALGFCPMGAEPKGKFPLASTVTSDVRATAVMQKERETAIQGNEEKQLDESIAEVRKTFIGMEFLLDPRVWNSQDALSANVPAAGGRFSAAGLAQFYHELGNLGALVSKGTLRQVFESPTLETSVNPLQGITRIANDSVNRRTKLSLGFQLIQTERDDPTVYSGVGHAGVGGSIGFWHKPTGLSIGVMLNKADAGQEVTMSILRTIGDFYGI